MKPSKIIILIVLLLLIAGGVYWYMFFYGPGNGNPGTNSIPNNGSSGGFVPIGGPTGNPNSDQTQNQNNTINDNPNPATTTQSTNTPRQTLRLLSKEPVGGYGASTTASSTIIRWIERGRGNVLETRGDTDEIITLSNTVLPRMYDSIWNKDLSSLIGTLLPANSDTPNVVFAKLNKQSTSTLATTTNVTPYNLRGKNLPDNMLAYAISPKKDRLFMLIKENSQGVGYISKFDGTSVTKIFAQPLTQVVVEWPEENNIAITTKAGSSVSGYLYFINPKTGIWKKIIGPITGLATKVSKDAKYVLTSSTGKEQNIVTNIYKVGSTTPIETTLRISAEKCTWGNFYKELLYCATPSIPTNGTYPDDWYKGIISSNDKIWQYNIKSADVRLIANLLNSNSLINAFNLNTDNKDDYLFFMNKDDLSLWSLDLVGI